MAYCTIQDIREQGVPEPPAYGGKTDAQIQAAIDRSCILIDKYTGRFFEPRNLTITLDGTGSKILILGPPIIDITSIKIGADFSIASEVDLDGVRIYNRHLTENLTNPDDRESPKIEIQTDDRYEEHLPLLQDDETHYFRRTRWPSGTRNIQLIGKFGYTDYDSINPDGVTPLLIQRACTLMTIRDMHLVYSESARREDALYGWKVKQHKTRDQSITYADPASLANQTFGVYTGDPEIDKILLMYTRPPEFGGA
jgi:hypothetical protein